MSGRRGRSQDIQRLVALSYVYENVVA